MKPKINTVRLPADSCLVYTGRKVKDGEIVDQGQSHAIHAGEWVEVLPIQTVRELLSIEGLRTATDSIGGLRALCQELSSRLLAWNWTDMVGEVLPQPYRHPEVIEGLTPDELLWLVSQVQGQEDAEARKNGSALSARTS